MKTKKLLDILERFKFVFIGNNYISEANYIFVTPERNILWCYSDSHIYTHKYDGIISEDFQLETNSEFSIEAKKLYDLIKKIKQEEIILKEKDGVLIIRNGRSVNKIAFSKIKSNRKLEDYLNESWTSFPFTDLKSKLKTHFLFDRNDAKFKNAVIKDNTLYCSDRYNMFKYFLDGMAIPDCCISSENLKHVCDNEMCWISIKDDVIKFATQNHDTIVVCKNERHAPPIIDTFESMCEDINLRNSIYMNKEEDIDFIDTFLQDYKKLDKKIVVDIKDSEKLFITVDEGTCNSKMHIPIIKYKSGEPIYFKVNVDYFKDVYNKYDYFNILENSLYCTGEDGIERMIVISEVR